MPREQHRLDVGAVYGRPKDLDPPKSLIEENGINAPRFLLPPTVKTRLPLYLVPLRIPLGGSPLDAGPSSYMLLALEVGNAQIPDLVPLVGPNDRSSRVPPRPTLHSLPFPGANIYRRPLPVSSILYILTGLLTVSSALTLKSPPIKGPHTIHKLPQCTSC